MPSPSAFRWPTNLPLSGIITRRRGHVCALAIASTLAVCAAALWNGYPLVFPDTGAYLSTAEALIAPVGRPITYGLFARVTSGGVSLWFPIFAQSAILVWLVARTVRAVAPRASMWLVAGTLALLSLTTAVSVTASQLLPDVFAPIAILALALLARQEAIPWKERIALGCILAVATASHSSSLPTLVLTLGVTALHAITHQREPLRGSVRRLSWPALAIVIGGLMIPVSNAVWGRGFVLSEGAGAFLTARIAEIGALEPYLEARCDARPNPLCAASGRIPHQVNAFLWSRTSPFQELGSFGEASRKLQPLVSDFFHQPRFLARFALAGVRDGIACLVHFDVEHENVRPQGLGSPPQKVVARYFPVEAAAYLSSRQQRNTLGRLGVLNFCQDALILLAALALVLLWVRYARSLPEAGSRVVSVVLLAVTLNAFVCGALSTPSDARYSARVIWLVPLLAFAFGFQAFRSMREHRSG
jgi:hypothetical protein